MLADGTNGTSTPCGIGNQYNSSIVYLTPYFPVAMRAGPTIYEVGGTNYFRNYQNSAGVSYDADWQLRKGSTTCANIWTNSSSPGTGGHAVWVETNNTSARLGFIAEL